MAFSLLLPITAFLIGVPLAVVALLYLLVSDALGNKLIAAAYLILVGMGGILWWRRRRGRLL